MTQLSQETLRLLACLALLQGGQAATLNGFTGSLDDDGSRIALAVLISACVLGALSLALLLLAGLELNGRCFLARCFSYVPAHAVMAALWLPIVGLSVYLLAAEHFLPAIAFVAGGCVLAAAHCVLIAVSTCWCCCGGAFVGASSPDTNPKSALLTPQGAQHRGRGGGPGASADPGVGGHGAPHAAEGGNGDGRGGGGGGSVGGPFRATYGLLPGSSSAYAYQIFIPGADEEQANFGAYASLPTPTPPSQRAERTPARAGSSSGAPRAQSVQPFAQQLQQPAQQPRQLRQ